jgi:hypothetical protein
VTYALDELGGQWAVELGAFDEEHEVECWELPATQKNGYPGLHKQLKRAAGQLPGVVVAGMQLSHLCHNVLCVNPAHCVLEPGPVNQGRSACVGGRWCRHATACLRPGRYARGFLTQPDYPGQAVLGGAGGEDDDSGDDGDDEEEEDGGGDGGADDDGEGDGEEGDEDADEPIYDGLDDIGGGLNLAGH